MNIHRIQYWLSVGAQPSDTVGRLLGTSGLFARHPRSFRDKPPTDESSTAADVGGSTDMPQTGPLTSTAPASRGLCDVIDIACADQQT